MTKEELIEFETRIGNAFNNKEIACSIGKIEGSKE